MTWIAFPKGLSLLPKNWTVFPKGWTVLPLILTGCATPGETITVSVPTPVPCVSKDFPPPPAYPDTRTALTTAPDQAEFLRLLAAGWPLRVARLDALENALTICREK
jgi:hypothetical protein